MSLTKTLKPDDEYLDGLVNEVEKEHDDDVKVAFMHPSYPASCFCCPKGDDTCYVPIVNGVLDIKNVPFSLNSENLDFVL